MVNKEEDKNSLAYKLGQIVGAVLLLGGAGCVMAILIALVIKLIQWIL